MLLFPLSCSLWLIILFFFGCFVVISSFPLIDVCEQSSDFSDISESAADYFSRSNRRGSVVSDLDDLSIPDLDAVSGLRSLSRSATPVTGGLL